MIQIVARRSDGVVIHIEPLTTVNGKLVGVRANAAVLSEVAATNGITEAELAITTPTSSDYRSIRRIGGDIQADIGDGDAMTNFRQSAAWQRQQLLHYAEERGLRRGALLRDPDDDSRVVSEDADLETIRRATNRLRVKVIERAKRGGAEIKAKAQAIRDAEDSIAIAVYDVSQQIAAGTVTTESEVDAAIDAVAIP